jgi:predicted nucleic acid-binding protein
MDNSSICVDASLVVRLLVDSNGKDIQTLWQEWETAARQIVAPTLLYYEVANALYQYQKHGYLQAETVFQAMEVALQLPIRLQEGEHHHLRALRISQQFELPATYDAHYLAVAENLNATFWTADRRLVTTIQPELTWVRLWE